MLKELNIESIDDRDGGLRGKPDEEIFEYAVDHKAAILTADRGFGNIHRIPLGSHSGIVILRFPSDMAPEDFKNFVLENLSKVRAKEIEGRVIIVEEDRIRTRK